LKKKPKGAAWRKWPLLNYPLRTLGATLATSLAQRQRGYRIRRRLAGFGPKENCQWLPSIQSPCTTGSKFPAAIGRLGVNVESGFLIARPDISPHPVAAKSCDIGCL
jgi:hypothetical protein